METFINEFVSLSEVEFFSVAINIVLSGIVSHFIYFTFIRFGKTMSNRKQFGNIFFMIAVSTTLIISIIKSSLALSLGLVGALSIVRFRTAVKEPEELAYLFLVITMGIGYGANTYLLTTVSTFIILLILVIKGILFDKQVISDVFNLMVNSKLLGLEETLGLLKKRSDSIKVVRVDTNAQSNTFFFKVVFKSVNDLSASQQILKEIDHEVVVQYSAISSLN
jgi:uncharacterized membrane protein YhiD involved in acid resistance